MAEDIPILNEWIKMQEEFFGKYKTQNESNNVLLNEWLESVDIWWKKHSKDSPNTVNSLYKKLLFSSNYFVSFAEPFISIEHNTTDARHVLVKSFELFLESVSKDYSAKSNIKGFWKLPFEVWRQQLAVLGKLEENFLKLLHNSTKESCLSEDYIEAAENYLKSLNRYQSGFLNMAIQAATQLIEKIERIADDKQLSYQCIRSLWADIFDKHYNVFVRSSEFPQLQANVVNSYMLLALKSEELFSPWLKSLNIPERQDFDSLLAKQKKLLEDNRSLRNQLKSIRATE